LAVSHDSFLEIDYTNYLKGEGVIYDVKGVLGSIADKKL